MTIKTFGALAIAAAATIFSAPNADAEITLSSKSEVPADLGQNLSTLLGTDAPQVTTARASALDGLFSKRKPAAAVPSIEYSDAFLAQLPAVKGDEQWQCLTEALYFEARGESVRGLFAVAEVILNRVDSSAFPGTVCGVVNQGTGRKYQCQFTYTCDGLSEVVHEPRAYERVGKVARLMLDGAERTLTDGAEFYHTKAVSPRWSRIFDRTTTIGAHHFYAQG
ncbi:cell wall hydrolase [Palleronia pelagia]|uniref:Cell wall hydrolase CwlJ, involved in spore germination n=1 Tax=Palleronia pelagia TaxID=387096 RepID=A0A1H8KSF8_9RHOB|nr:cell wall hydrolase [Palleronia pelagia]SEN95348.1 Cell wall hydrolase CwlJ, involved in spore germination [Palleronia pelagia]